MKKGITTNDDEKHYKKRMNHSLEDEFMFKILKSI